MRLFRKKQGEDPLKPEDYRLAELLSHHGIRTVLDIGANRGQYRTRLRLAGYRGRIVSFEPLSSHRETLLTLAKDDPLWDIAPRVAIGETRGEAEINVSEGDDMSSLLKVEETLLTALPRSRVLGRETVPVETLDHLWDTVVRRGDDPVFVKVDTQGFELPVIKGAESLIRAGKIAGWQLELSLLPLYGGEPTFEKVTAHLTERGYEVHLILSGYFSKRLNRQLQIDEIFFRKE